MRAAVFNGPHSIEVVDRPDPVVAAPTDAVVRVALGCVCGSDLWYYRGESPHDLGPIGHEFIGVVEQVGAAVREVAEGDFVIAPFKYSDGTCANCRTGWPSSCVSGGPFGTNGIDGGQGEAVRVPYADGTLVRISAPGLSDDIMRSLLTLTDVMCTGHHVAVSAGVRRGSTVAVVGAGRLDCAPSLLPSVWELPGSLPSAGMRRARRWRANLGRRTSSPSAAMRRPARSEI
jgi:threonine dehydrogenase-like Zn-dependent dehydrogenase